MELRENLAYFSSGNVNREKISQIFSRETEIFQKMEILRHLLMFQETEIPYISQKGILRTLTYVGLWYI